jgi:hypothetical protein
MRGQRPSATSWVWSAGFAAFWALLTVLQFERDDDVLMSWLSLLVAVGCAVRAVVDRRRWQAAVRASTAPGNAG